MLTKLLKRLNIIKNKIQHLSGIRKHEKQDHDLSKGDFHRTVVKPFIHALIEEMKGGFDTSNLPVLNAFLKIDPWGLPNMVSISFEN